MHGIFSSNEFRRHVLGEFGVTSTHDHDAAVDDALDRWADQLETELHLDELFAVSTRR